MARVSAPDILIPAALKGDRRSLARLITIVENGDDNALDILSRVFDDGGNAWTTGLTGAPGAGKSTLTDRLITSGRSAGEQVAVVAVDPSSPFSGGAVLGDRVRMQDHIDDHGVYIRSMASRGHLGGISAATPRVVALLDALGFREIIVETVGVGQAEVEIAGNADTTLVVVNPGWGDSVQAAKAGLLEIGDVFVVNKADRPGTSETVRDLTQMLELGGHREWSPPIVCTVASTGEGTDELWNAVLDHRRFLKASGLVAKQRSRRRVTEMEAALASGMWARMRSSVPESDWDAVTSRVAERDVDPWSAAALLLKAVGVTSTQLDKERGV